MAATLTGVRNLFLLLCLLACGLAPAQAQTAAGALTPQQARALVERVLATESRAAEDLGHASHPMRYRLHKTSPRLSSTKEIVETRDGDVARLLTINGQPLSADDEQREQARLDALLANPSLQQHRKQSEDGDAARAMKILRVLPSAFLYQFAGTAVAPSGVVEKFTFSPNPRFDPPDMETGILTAMAGELWIDPVQERVVRLAGSLQQDKNLALGLVALDKGGWVEINQADVGNHQWRIVELKLKMNARILFKAKPSDSVQEYSEFAPLPADLSYGQAIEILRSIPGGGQGNR